MFGVSKLRTVCLALVLAAAVLGCSSAAYADATTFNLTVPNTQLSGTYPPGTVFATVSLTTVGNNISATVTGGPGFSLFGQGGMVGFNVAGNTTGLAISGLASGFSYSGGGQMDGFGNFQVVIDGPQASQNVSSVSFTVSRTDGFTSVNQLGPFVAHVYADGNGLTGFAGGGGGEVPEPGTLALLGSGLLAVGGFLRRRK